MQELRFAVRALRATPIVTLVAVLSLALGIGANTAIFSIVNSLLLRALPVVEPQRLATIATPRVVELGGTGGWSNPIWEQVRALKLFDSTLAWGTQRFNLAKGGETQFIDGLLTSGSYFQVLGVPALLGRTITDADDRRGGGPDGAVAVLSYGFWQRRFGGAADAVGQTLVIENVPFTIIGITPPGFFGMVVGRTFDVAVPIGDEPLLRGRDSILDSPNVFFLTIVARLRAEQTLEAAKTTLQGVQPQIREATLPPNVPQAYLDRYLTGREGFTLVSTAADNSGLRGRYRRPLLTIMVVIALVLLIACANIANVLLARTTARRHELSVRLALGAARWRLVRPLLTESLVLAAAGAAFGMVIAAWGSRLLVRQLSTRTNTVFLDLPIEWPVLAFTSGVMAAAALLSGIAPALRTSGVAPMDALKEQGRGTAGDASVSVASGLIVAQVVLSVVLIVTAGLFLRTFATLAARDLGFERDRALLVNVNAQRASVEPAQRRPLLERTRDAVRVLPGVAEAALSIMTPVQGGGMIRNIQVSGGVSVPATVLGGIGNCWGNEISARWFSTFGIPIIAGRDFADGDRVGSLRVAIVNQTLVRKFFDGRNPLGQTITNIPPFGEPQEIVGIVGDAVYGSLREPAPPTVYSPLAQFEGPDRLASVNLSVRSSGDSPALLTKSVAAAVGSLDPGLALTFRPLADQVNASLTQERLVAMLSGFFGVLALLLAGLGLYGVTSYSVARRRSEIGVRMALGASPAGVVRLVLLRVAWLVAIGVGVGAVVSLWASQFVAALLYGLSPRDPVTLVGAACVLMAVGAFAGWLPAWRASRIDPAQVLRDN